MLKSLASKDCAEMLKNDMVVVSCEFGSSVCQFTPAGNWRGGAGGWAKAR